MTFKLEMLTVSIRKVRTKPLSPLAVGLRLKKHPADWPSPFAGCHGFAILPQCATLLQGTCRRIPKASGGILTRPQSSRYSSGQQSQECVDSLMAGHVLPMMGEKVRSLFAANASQGLWQWNSEIRKRAFFRWLDSGPSSQTATGRVENAQLTASANEVVATGPVQEQWLQQPSRISYSPWRMGASQVWRMRYLRQLYVHRKDCVH